MSFSQNGESLLTGESAPKSVDVVLLGCPIETCAFVEAQFGSAGARWADAVQRFFGIVLSVGPPQSGSQAAFQRWFHLIQFARVEAMGTPL